MLLCSGACRTLENYNNLLRIPQILRFEIADSRFLLRTSLLHSSYPLSKFRGFYHMKEVPSSAAGFHSSRLAIFCTILFVSTALFAQTSVPATKSSAQDSATSDATAPNEQNAAADEVEQASNASSRALKIGG